MDNTHTPQGDAAFWAVAKEQKDFKARLLSDLKDRGCWMTKGTLLEIFHELCLEEGFSEERIDQFISDTLSFLRE